MYHPVYQQIILQIIKSNNIVQLVLTKYLAKVKAIPVRAYYRARGFQEVEVPRFHDNRHMKVILLSALSTGHLYSLGNIHGTHFC